MIRINLLGVQKPKKSKRSVSVNLPSGGPGLLIALAVALAITAAGNAGYYWLLRQQAEKTARDLASAEVEFQRLSQVKQKYEEREKQLQVYQRRVEVIDKLKRDQSGPVNLLTMIGDTVNHTDEVWLTTMTDDGSNINVKGMALSVHAVANLMRNLQRTGFFRTVEINESYQDDSVRDIQAFFFSLKCQKQAAVPPPPKKA